MRDETQIRGRPSDSNRYRSTKNIKIADSNWGIKYTANRAYTHIRYLEQTGRFLAQAIPPKKECTHIRTFQSIARQIGISPCLLCAMAAQLIRCDVRDKCACRPFAVAKRKRQLGGKSGYQSCSAVMLCAAKHSAKRLDLHTVKVTAITKGTVNTTGI